MEKFSDFLKFKTFLPNDNLDVRSYGHLLTMFFYYLKKFSRLGGGLTLHTKMYNKP